MTVRSFSSRPATRSADSGAGRKLVIKERASLSKHLAKSSC